MLMVKDELVNAVKLFKIKWRSQRKGNLWFLGIAGFMLGINLSSVINGIMQYIDNGGNNAATTYYSRNGSGVMYYNALDFSNILFAGLVVGLLTIMFMYRQTNDKFSVFPQTNTSRFVSSQLMNYAIVLGVALTALVMYLLQYGIIRLVTRSAEDFHFAPFFDAGFLAAGFFAFLVYGFLIVAVINLAGVILLKWRYYAVAAFVVLIISAVVFIGPVVEYVPKTLAFLIREQSVGLFVLKGAGLWLAIVAVSLVINRYMVYYKSHKPTNRIRDILAGVLIALIVTSIGLGMTLRYYTFNSGSWGMSSGFLVTQEDIREFYRISETRIDVSSLPKGSVIDVQGENISIRGRDPEADSHSYWGEEAHTAHAWFFNPGPFDDFREHLVYPFDDLQSDTIIIEFQPPKFYVSGFDVHRDTNARINAYMDGTTLNVDYSIDKAQVAIMPIWGIAGQFTDFKDRGLIADYRLGISGWDAGAVITIGVE